MPSTIPRTLAAAAITLAATAAFPQERGSCVTVEVPAPIAMPDGGVHDSGTLRLCFTSRLSPVNAFHSIAVNGISLGLYPSRTDRAEGAALPDPVIAFVREESGALRLVGYAWPRGDHMRTYRFGPTLPALEIARVANRSVGAQVDGSAPVWIAARRD